MATPEALLARLVRRLLRRSGLREEERREVMHIARGLSARAAAEVERVPVKTIRNRRKAVCRKLGLPGVSELLSSLLALSLAALAGEKRAPRRPSRARGEG